MEFRSLWLLECRVPSCVCVCAVLRSFTVFNFTNGTVWEHVRMQGEVKNGMWFNFKYKLVCVFCFSAVSLSEFRLDGDGANVMENQCPLFVVVVVIVVSVVVAGVGQLSPRSTYRYLPSIDCARSVFPSHAIELIKFMEILITCICVNRNARALFHGK